MEGRIDQAEGLARKDRPRDEICVHCGRIVPLHPGSEKLRG